MQIDALLSAIVFHVKQTCNLVLKKFHMIFVDISETKPYYLIENVSHRRSLWKLQNY